MLKAAKIRRSACRRRGKALQWAVAMKLPSRFPISQLLGFELVSAGDGTATVVFQAEERHDNVQGTLHGGVLCDIADAAMGNAFRSGLPEDVGLTTVELQIHFLRPVRRDRLTAVGKVVRRGRRLGYMECDITNQRGELVARAACTCMALPPREAEAPSAP